MPYIRVAGVSDIPEGKMRQVDLNGTPVLIAKVNGTFHAIGGLCTHRQGILANGTLNGTVVTCPRHGSQFDVSTGKNLMGPKVIGMRLKTGDEPVFEVKVEGADVMVRSD
ncbi:MAG: ferredoxin [Candidatus Thorarchaeota archaeon]|nr:MAG: ferredoxin [Candidatus Thorarchaeota archaeon]